MSDTQLNTSAAVGLAQDSKSPKKKMVWLEMLRIFAVLLVIFNHTGDYGFHYWATLDGGYRYWLFMACAALTVMNIPIFYMISGALLMGKEESIQTVWRKRVLRYALVILIFTFVQYLYLCFTSEDGFRETFSVWEWFVTMLSENIIVPYWFLYEYLGFLVMLPLYRRMLQNMKEEEFHYLFLLYIVFTGALPIIEYILTKWHTILNISFNIAYITGDLLVYPALGFYLIRKPKPTWKQLAVMWGLSLLCVVYTCLMTEYKLDYARQLSEARVGTFFKMLICIPAVTVFLTARKLFDTSDGKGITMHAGVEKLMLSMGSCVFGVYLVEQIFRNLMYDFGMVMVDHLPNFVATLIYCVVVFLAAYLVVLVLKLIPGLKKLL